MAGVIKSDNESTTEIAGFTESDNGSTRKSVSVEEEDQALPKLSYIEKCKVIVSLLPTTVDHASDILILVSLLSKGEWKLFFIGAGIDFLPGPVTTFQFWRDAHGLRDSLKLFVHPLNPYVHALKIMASKQRVTFSEKVVNFAKECQGMIESPIQLIFTSSLIYMGILPSPFDKDEAVTWTNRHGTRINFSYLPFLSVIVSFVSIIFNSASSLKVFENPLQHLDKTTSLVLFLVSVVLFRIQAWVFTTVFIAEFVLIMAVILLIINFTLFLRYRSETQQDPLLMTIYSFVVPTIALRSVASQHGCFSEKLHKLQMLLTIAGNVVLLITSCYVFTAVKERMIPYSSTVRLRRDTLSPVFYSTIALAFASSLSVIFVSRSQRDLKETETEEEDKSTSILPEKLQSLCDCGTIRRLWNDLSQKLAAFVTIWRASRNVGLLCLVIIAFLMPHVIHREEVELNTIVTHGCGEKLLNPKSGEESPVTVTGYITKPVNISTNVVACPYPLLENVAEEEDDFIGCIGNVYVFEDRFPTSALSVPMKNLSILFASEESAKKLREVLGASCSAPLSTVILANDINFDSINILDLRENNKKSVMSSIPFRKEFLDLRNKLASGFFIDGHLVLCRYVYCYKYNPVKERWIEMEAKMTTPRLAPLFVQFSKSKVWILSGTTFAGNGQWPRVTTTELYDSHTMQFTEYVALPPNISVEHTPNWGCKLDEHHFIFAGTPQRTIYFLFNWKTKTWSQPIEAPSSKVVGVVRLKNGTGLVVVAGAGNAGLDSFFFTKEVFDSGIKRLDKNSLVAGPPLPVSISGAKSLSRGETFLIMDGITKDNESNIRPNRDIFEFSFEKWAWVKLNLKFPRLPSNTFPILVSRSSIGWM